VKEEELRTDSRRLTLRNPPLPAPVVDSVVLSGHRVAIQGLLDVFGGNLEVQSVARRGDLFGVRIAKQEGVPYSFFLHAESQIDHPQHPSKNGVGVYDYLDPAGWFVADTSAAVKAICDLSRRLYDDPRDYGAVLSEDGLYARAASLTLLIDVAALGSEAGQKDFCQVIASLLMLRDGQYIGFSAAYGSTLRVFKSVNSATADELD